ncbi:DUF1553 domain-containing protein [Roseiconus nitratireducens]|nr:DUF1553 domain-containing protein [Roseiconus nitratireducens]
MPHLRHLLVCLATTFVCVATADEASPDETTSSEAINLQGSGAARIDFENDVLPRLTRHGCNGGACHGAAAGRGGFKLSLYGGDPDADFDQIVRNLGGRRINLNDAELSLLIRKPTETVEHGGGAVLSEADAQQLIAWIDQGAPRTPQRQLQRVQVDPTRHVAPAAGHSVSLRTTAIYQDGSQRDVTDQTIFSSADPSAVRIEPLSGTATVLRAGRHVVIARYWNRVVPVELIGAHDNSPISPDERAADNFIDQEVIEALATLRLPPSGPADDAVFLRRLSLDLTGRLPTPEQTLRFLLDTRPDKRDRLLNRLLDGEAFNEYWTLQLATLLRLRPRGDDPEGAHVYHDWLAQQLRDRRGYDAIARSLLLSGGDTHVIGPANFYRMADGPRQQAELFSEVLMASRLRCANCHNHPLDRWTQDDYHGLAAIFATLQTGREVRPNPDGYVVHPRTLEPATPRLPGQQDLPTDRADVRVALADWLIDPDNPYFAKAMVNRLWQRMMGRGLVEPVDDFRATNPATHPRLLQRLADDFVAHGYDLRHTLRQIAQTQTYARSADATSANRNDQAFYSHRLRRPLDAEVLADAISDVLGVAETYGDQPIGTRAVALLDPSTESETLDVLGRCDRTSSCATPSASAGGLTQQLHRFNGDMLNQRIAVSGGRLDGLLDQSTPPEEIIQTFYLAALCRQPTERERRHWNEQLNRLSSSADRRTFLEDLVWGLLSCEEFVTNH